MCIVFFKNQKGQVGSLAAGEISCLNVKVTVARSNQSETETMRNRNFTVGDGIG